MKNIKLTKQQIISSFSLVIFIAVIVILVKVFLLPAKEVSQPTLFTPPTYLTVPISPLDNINKIFQNSRFQELAYLESLFGTIKVKARGRPNPFIPY